MAPTHTDGDTHQTDGDTHTDGTVTPSSDHFLPSAPWYQDISAAPLDDKSDDIIAGLDAAGGWGHGNQLQIDFSFVVLHADASVTPRPFEIETQDFYSPDCDSMPVPLPPGGQIEGSPTNDYACTDGDCHLLVFQGDYLYETGKSNVSDGTATGGTFTSGCAVRWDLTHDYWDPAQSAASYGRGADCTSADAAGFPIAPLLFTGAELDAGEIDHAIRFILPNDHISHKNYVHPATHSTNPTSGGPDTPPYGARLRLKSTFELASLPSDAARTVARAMQKYGIVLADAGEIGITAESSAAGKIDSHDLYGIHVTDFDMIDGGTRYDCNCDCQRTPITSN